jgi:hypothetical protein
MTGKMIGGKVQLKPTEDALRHSLLSPLPSSDL